MPIRIALLLAAIAMAVAVPATAGAATAPSMRTVTYCAEGTYWTAKPVLAGPTGNPPVGSVITTTPGVYAGIPIGCSYEVRYQWYRYNTSRDTAPYAIPNSNASSYTLASADIGFAIGVCSYAYPGQIPSSGGTPRTMDCSATTLTVRAPDAPAPAPVVPVAAAAPKAPSAPAGVKWVASTPGKPFTATFTAAPGTTYSISATPSGKKGVKGTCKAKGVKVTCGIRLAKGTWVVSITPTMNGVVGTPLKKTVKVAGIRR